MTAALTEKPAPDTEIPQEVLFEGKLCGPSRNSINDNEIAGKQLPVACPDCGGPMWQLGDGLSATVRCHTGHAYSLKFLLEGQSEEIERSLWVSIRAFKEKSAVLQKLAFGMKAKGSKIALDYASRAEEADAHAERLREFLMALTMQGSIEQDGPSLQEEQ